MASTLEFLLHFVRCDDCDVTVTVSPNQITIISMTVLKVFVSLNFIYLDLNLTTT